MARSYIFLFLVIAWVARGEEWNKVYLASFPRSGNHWVRFLIEEATHIATSSVYRDSDYFHLPTLFPWGAYSTKNGYAGNCRYPTEQDPVVIKTHHPCLHGSIDPSTQAVICLIRHPIDAFWSFYMYQKNKRGSSGSKDMPEAKLQEFIELWRNFYEFWESRPGVIFIRYEDLLADTEPQLQLILQTAGFSFDKADIERAICKYPPADRSLKHLRHYDARRLNMIRESLQDVLERYGYDF